MTFQTRIMKIYVPKRLWITQAPEIYRLVIWSVTVAVNGLSIFYSTETCEYAEQCHLNCWKLG